jgi:cell wall-associated NlpC family hydrolase
MVAASFARSPAAPAEQWASLDDTYMGSYSSAFDDGEAAYAVYSGGGQLIDPASAVSGLSGSLWTSRAGESLVSGSSASSGPRVVNASAKIKPSELPGLTYRDNAPGSSKSPRSAKGVTPKILTSAFSVAGTPFKQGQASPQAGFDNAGFISYVYSQGSVRLPRSRTTADLVAAGKPVTKDELRPGDMVVYNDPKKSGSWLLGIYSGNGNFLLASPRLNVVAETAAFGTDYGPYFVGGRRLYDDPSAEPLSEEDKMAVTNGAVMTALSQLDDIPRMQPAPSSVSYRSRSKSSSRSRGRSRSVSARGKGGKKVYARSKAKASSRSRKPVPKRRRG